MKTESAKKEPVDLVPLLKELWFYHRPTKYIVSDTEFEMKKMDLALEIRQELETSIESNNQKIAQIMEKHPNAAEVNDTTGF